MVYWAISRTSALNRGDGLIIRTELIIYHQYYKLDRCESVCVSVCLSVTDVTSLPQRILWERDYKSIYYNAYAGNESRNCGAPPWPAIRAISHSYRKATKAGQTTLEQVKTVLSTSRILS